jgi:hypothetical protein
MMSSQKVFVPFLLRALVSVHFVTELYDKIVNFDVWQKVIQQNTQFGEWALYLVIGLLLIGSTLLLSNNYLYTSAFCLLLFQIPTTIMFETTDYERFYSITAMGGICAVVWFTHEVTLILNMKAELERLSDMNIGYNKI